MNSQNRDASSFRLWVQRFYMENCEERRLFLDTPMDHREYFNRYKYWLKGKYREHTRNSARTG